MRSVESLDTIVADGAGVVLFGTLGVAWHREQRGVNGEPFPKMTLHERGHVQVAKYLLGDWPYCVYGVGYEYLSGDRGRKRGRDPGSHDYSFLLRLSQLPLGTRNRYPRCVIFHVTRRF